jgi:ribulose-phosphate 3-epimerase
MSTVASAGGQTFIPSSLERIAEMRRLLDSRGLTHVELGVDGGVNGATIGPVALAGATRVVSGSGVFNSHASVADNVRDLHRASRIGPVESAG